MPTMNGLGIEVTAPAPAPYRHGLFSVQAPAAAPQGFGSNGYVWWLSRGCAPAGVTASPCVQDNPAALTVNSSCVVPDATPFWVYAYSRNSIIEGLQETRDEARDILALGEQFAVEQAVWADLTASVTEVAVSGGIVRGLAMVEQMLAEAYGGQGVIHLSRFAATVALGSGLLETAGERLLTKLGTPVAAGGGYGTVGTTVPTTVAVYGTGPLVLVAGATDVLEAIPEPAINNVHALAFRPWAAGWDCTAVGATITL